MIGRALALLLLALNGPAGSVTQELDITVTIGTTAQTPGPSQALFNSPYYTCVTKRYVATNGSNSYDGTQATHPALPAGNTIGPWATLAQANASIPNPAPGYCINVAPGTYANGTSITKGGNLASATGYVVYRCTTMDACTITNNHYAFSILGAPASAKYVIIDGFTLAAASQVPYGQGVRVAASSGGDTAFATHHIWVINCIISGYGQAGLQLNDGEFFYVIHNKLYNNTNGSTGIYGSNISLYEIKAVPSYTPTADNSTNPNPLIGSFVTGATFFRQVIEWNVSYNSNQATCCVSGSTDANGIILDDWENAQQTPHVAYPNQGLVAFNIVYNNYGGGIHNFSSLNVTIANNSCYNNYLTPLDPATWRGCINSAGSHSSTYFNNISVAIPAASGYLCGNSAVLIADDTTPHTTWTNNITKQMGPNTPGCNGEISIQGGGGSYSAAANKQNTDPLWANVGRTSSGTATTQPNGANFALCTAVGVPNAACTGPSPAIGYGLTATYLPSTSVDVGACHHSLTTCP